MKVEHKYNGDKIKFCTGLGKGSKCSVDKQCNDSLKCVYDKNLSTETMITVCK